MAWPYPIALRRVRIKVARNLGLAMEGTTTSEARDGKEFTTVIVDSGDIRLNICHDLANRNTQTFSYRVDTTCLRRTSRFFDRLLSGQFVEAQRISEGLERLRKQYKNMIEAPISELPSVNIEDVGRVAISKSVQPLMADFLRALHGAGIESKVSIPNMANLVVVADRFDALPYFSEYVRKRKLLRGKDTPEQKLSEERLRQKLYVGILLNHEAWVAPPSHRIITRGSESWKMDSDFINSAYSTASLNVTLSESMDQTLLPLRPVSLAKWNNELPYASQNPHTVSVEPLIKAEFDEPQF
ncbi:MAG: hypothetical protein Q9157_004261 [Trypethelium eluteriae]